MTYLCTLDLDTFGVEPGYSFGMRAKMLELDSFVNNLE